MAVVVTERGVSLEAIGKRLERVIEEIRTRTIFGGEYTYDEFTVRGQEQLQALLRDVDHALITSQAGVRCRDCGLPYADFPLDMTLPDEQWLMIHPEDGGVLCACCIVKRAERLPGRIAVRARIEFTETR